VSASGTAEVAARRRAAPTRSGTLRRAVAALARIAATLLVLSIGTFAANNSRTPQQVATAALGAYTTPEQRAAFIAAHGLDAPVVVRYLRWIGGAVRGDWGTSVISRLPVTDLIAGRVERTVTLAGLSMLVAILLALPLAVYAARRRGSRQDVALLTGTTLLVAIPDFILGLCLMLLFGVALGVLPITSRAVVFGSGSQVVLAYVLPTLTLALIAVPHLVRVGRAVLTEAFDSPSIRSATLRGLSPGRITVDYALRQCAPVLLQTISITITWLLGDAVVIENVFGFPGLGQELVTAVSTGDATTLQAVVLLLGAIFIGVNGACDLLAVALNPRLRGRSSGAAA
jgi:peptide/nickel transport system permease protein